MRLISGLPKTEDGAVIDGSIEFTELRIDGRDPDRICRLETVQVSGAAGASRRLPVRGEQQMLVIGAR